MAATRRRHSDFRVAFGPAMPGWGSWEWLGSDLVDQMGAQAVSFSAWEEPIADIVVLVKHAPPLEWVERVARTAPLVYLPVDRFDSAEEIQDDAPFLRSCRHIIANCSRLLPFVAPFAPCSYLDHHLKYSIPVRRSFPMEGRLLWVGVHTNLPPLVEWVNEHPLPLPLDVLTNLEESDSRVEAASWGFRADAMVRVRSWTPALHRRLLGEARAAIDIKGEEFRSRHKPPAKALDFVASGLPLAMNADSSPVEHLATLELAVPTPLEVDRWLSRDYWKETCRLGRKLNRSLSIDRIAARLKSLLAGIVADRNSPRSKQVGARSAETIVNVPASEDFTNAKPSAPRNSPELRLYGLLITKDDHDVFSDWCRSQLPLYNAVVCLDGSESDETARLAAPFSEKLIYLRERDFDIPHKTDHGLRRVVHQEIDKRFGHGHWIMCCHTDEYCYHDPRLMAAKAQREGFDLVSWFSPHFYPHPSELPEWPQLRTLPLPDRFRHYHWSYHGDGFPWIEDRLYLAAPDVAWDDVTHGSVRPHGIKKEASFRPTLRHFKVALTDPQEYERQDACAHYKHHWGNLKHRTGLPFPVRRFEDLFVTSVPKYTRCDRFNGSFDHAWNLGEEYRVDPGRAAPIEKVRTPYEQARELALAGDHDGAIVYLKQIEQTESDPKRRAVALNDLAVLDALSGRLTSARSGFEAALELDSECYEATANLALLTADASEAPAAPVIQAGPSSPAIRVAIVSFLFNWPSTGGGIVHTVELARFLGEAGYTVRHFHVQFEPWGIGTVTEPLPFESEALTFGEREWNASWIQQRFRVAVKSFAPDYVILTDSWNFKPLLAEAVSEFPYILRLQALECVCPLNNVRLLPEPGGRARQCSLHQLATPDACRRCVAERGRSSGALHQAERELSGVGTAEYDRCLRFAFANAEVVLVVNPLTEAMVSPYAKNTRVVTAGMDPARFPWPQPVRRDDGHLKRILFAGLTQEWMKGFHVLRDACARLWSKRRDFELVATADRIDEDEPYIRFVGWQSQEELPKQLWESDLLVMPTIAQEALGRTAVEAMAAGRPVVASRLGGLPFTVADGATGLLAEPGDAADLAAKLTMLLDDAALRDRMGQMGRRRFEEHYAWPVIIERHYRPLLVRYRHD